ncbi:MAG: hypothetical protein P4L81_03480, partial [Candidatus Pacebacteria bacterium]|nr:hypothetical protein [Candidatus Paceibacterota bacterium]
MTRDEIIEVLRDVIDDLRSRYDRYGLALMMIREGVADPKEVAAKALDRAALTAPPALRVS